MKFYLKDSAIFMKDTALALNGEPLPLIRDQQASNEVLQYIVDAMNEKWERDPQKLRDRNLPPAAESPSAGPADSSTEGDPVVWSSGQFRDSNTDSKTTKKPVFDPSLSQSTPPNCLKNQTSLSTTRSS